MKTLHIALNFVFAFLLIFSSGCDYGDIANIAEKKLGTKVSGSLFVAVGDNGAIWYSSDGSSWTDTGHKGSMIYNAVAYGNGCFVAVGDSGVISQSSDGTNWTDITPINSNTLYCVVYGNGMFVAAGAFISPSGPTQISVSNDGKTWIDKSYNFGSGVNIRTIVYGNNSFLIAGDVSTFRWCSDASLGTWNTQTPPGSADLKAGIFNNNSFHLFGYSSPDYVSWYSTDYFATWNAGAVLPGSVNGVAYGANGYVVVGAGGSAAMSPDGITNWSPLTTGYIHGSLLDRVRQRQVRGSRKHEHHDMDFGCSEVEQDNRRGEHNIQGCRLQALMYRMAADTRVCGLIIDIGLDFYDLLSFC